MATNDADTVFLFSHGTLQQEDVQRASFGRLLTGTADAYEVSDYERIAVRLASGTEARVYVKA